MRILIAGEPDAGQREIITKLTGHEPTDSVVGFTLDHCFNTKYFSANCGIWADEITSLQEWTDEFCHDDAREVREELALFIYTFRNKPRELDPLAKFARTLKPGICLAVPFCEEPDDAAFEDAGFDIVPLEELEPAVHSAVYDSLQDESEDEISETPSEPGTATEPMRRRSMDFDRILQELIDARNSSTMSNEDKQALADRIAGELVD